MRAKAEHHSRFRHCTTMRRMLRVAATLFLTAAILILTSPTRARTAVNQHTATLRQDQPSAAPTESSSSPASEKQAAPNPSSTVPGVQGGTGAPAGLLIPGSQTITPAPSPDVLIVTVEGQTLDAASINPQVQYALRSMRLLLSKYNILMFTTADLVTPADSTNYCSGPFKNVPLLRLNFTQLPATQNTYTSGYHLHVEIMGTEFACSATERTIMPAGLTVMGIEDHTYVANPFTALSAVLAFLTSPWINKYKTWLTGPTAVVGSFEHVNEAANGAVYCATARLTSQLLLSDQWITKPIPVDAPNPLYLPCTPPSTEYVDRYKDKVQRRQAASAPTTAPTTIPATQPVTPTPTATRQ